MNFCNNINNKNTIFNTRRQKRDLEDMLFNNKMPPNNHSNIMQLPNSKENINDINGDCVNFNKKLKLENSPLDKHHTEKYQQNLLKFEKLAEHIDNSNNNIFDVTPKLFMPNGIHLFENTQLYNKVLRNGANLSHGSRLSNISQRIVNKNRLRNGNNSKVMKTDGLKSYYKVTLKNHMSQSKNSFSEPHLNNNFGTRTSSERQPENDKNNKAAPVSAPHASLVKPVPSTASLFQKKFTSSFLTSNSKKSLFSNITTSGKTTTPSATSSNKSQPPILQNKRHDYKKHYYSSDESDEYDFKQLPKKRSNFYLKSSADYKPKSQQSEPVKDGESSSMFSSDISLSSDSDDFEDDEKYWDEQFTPGNTKIAKKHAGAENFDEELEDSDGERDHRLDAYYHKKWDSLLKHNDLIHSTHDMRRIDSFERDDDSVFEETPKIDHISSEGVKDTEKQSNSNAPLTAHTLLPVAFHTHMFLPNSLQKSVNNGANNKESTADAMSYVGDEDDFKFFSEQQSAGVNEPAVKQALREDNDHKILKQKQVMQDLRKQATKNSKNYSISKN